MLAAGAKHRTKASGIAALTALGLATLLAFAFSAADAPGTALACDHTRAPSRSLSKSEARDSMRCLINGTRKHHGLHLLRPNNDLAGAAQKHTRLMRKKDCFSHQCPGEDDVLGRVRATGYFHGAGTYTFAENIDLNNRRSTPRTVFKAWMHSPGHRANILFGGSDDIGVGVSCHHRVWWTTDFGSRG